MNENIVMLSKSEWSHLKFIKRIHFCGWIAAIIALIFAIYFFCKDKAHQDSLNELEQVKHNVKELADNQNMMVNHFEKVYNLQSTLTSTLIDWQEAMRDKQNLGKSNQLLSQLGKK